MNDASRGRVAWLEAKAKSDPENAKIWLAYAEQWKAKLTHKDLK